MGDFAGKNVFSLSTKEIFESLSENIRHIASVEKTLQLPDGISIIVTSFTPSYRAFIGEEVFLLTENGQLIADIPEVEAPALEIRHLVSDPNLGKNTPIMIEDMSSMREILGIWRENLIKYPINALKFYDQEKEIHIVSNETLFIFSLTNGPIQMRTLIQILQQDHINTTRQAYIDLRVPKRIYVCAREESVCQQNINRIYNG
jgi:cell division septal protein FtsQ